MKSASSNPFILLLILLLSIPGVSFAQAGNGSLSGIIKDSTGAAVSHADVYLKHTKLGTTTDAEGKFMISDIPEGEYIIIVSLLGFETQKTKITIKNNQVSSADFILKEEHHKRDEFKVKAKSKNDQLLEQGYSVNVIDATTLQNRNIDVSKALNQSLGVRVRQDAGLGSSFTLTMNGLNAVQFVNGIPLEVYGSAFRLNNIPINQVQRVEVYKGVVPVSLGGDALGGAINIVTKSKLNNILNATYSYGSFNTHKGSLHGVYVDTTTGFTVAASGFINYSDNNYIMRNMEIVENSYFVKKNVRRFNDRYFSYSGRIETGLTGKKYADALLIGFGYTGIKQDIQTGPLQYPAAGDVTGKENSYQISLHYYKAGLWKDKIDLNMFVLYSNNHSNFIDTSSTSYQWDGTIWATRPPTSEDGELGDKQFFVNKESNIMQRYNITYRFNSAHNITLNFVSTISRRKSTDEWANASPTTQPSDYGKSIVGLGYDSKWFSNRLQNSLFAKMYSFSADIENALSWEGGWFRSHGLSTRKTYFGGGLGSSFILSKRFLLKASFEYAYRIPSTHEILGDGINTVANTNLLPESSLNYNAGIIFKCITTTNLNVVWSGYGFLRYATNFIRAIPGGRRVVYSNFSKVLIQGVETEIASTFFQKMNVRLNASYQQVLDNNEYVGSTKIENYTYRQQLPNTPYLFGNIDLSYNLLPLFNNKLQISPYYSLLYVNEFYLGFPNVAKGAEKYIIPTQMIHDVGITFSKSKLPFALSFECTNMTNALAYDNFRLQKPGRAYSIKLNYNLK